MTIAITALLTAVLGAALGLLFGLVLRRRAEGTHDHCLFEVTSV